MRYSRTVRRQLAVSNSCLPHFCPLSFVPSNFPKVPIFQNLAPSLLSRLVMILRPIKLLPGEVVIHAGDYGTEMYVCGCGCGCV